MECYKNAPAGSRIYLVRYDHLMEFGSDCGGQRQKICPEHQDISAMLDLYLKEFPESTVGRAFLADLKLKQNDLDGAIALYTESLSLDLLPGTFRERGMVYAKKQILCETLEDFHQSLTLDPDNISTLDERGKLYLRSGLYQEALKDFDNVIRLTPEILQRY